MHPRIIRSQIVPESTEESLAIWREQVMPLVRQQPGFRGAYVLGDRETGAGVTITLWESEAHATAVDTSGLLSTGDRPVARRCCEVSRHEQFEVLLSF